jgi:hypothetical protein
MVKLNPKLEAITVRDVVVEEADSHIGAEGNWRIYCASQSQGQAPFFLYVPGQGKVSLGSTDVYWERMMGSQELPLRFDEREAYDFSKFDFKLKGAFKRISNPKSDSSWNEFFEDDLRHFKIYRVAPPVSEAELKGLSQAELADSVEKHICGGFEVDERIRAWGFGNLVRFPQHSRFARFTKLRGHSLIIKSTKSGCSSIAGRTSPTYDHISPKSFEGYADADGEVMYSPLHGNFHACVLDELDQLTDGIMTKLFSFMESGRYTTVKAAKTISNIGNSRMSFITNPKSMDERRGTVYAVDSVLDAFYNVLYKLTAGNFNGGMSRFGNVIVSSKVKQARGKELFIVEQELANATASSLFEVIAPKVARIYENEQPQAWLAQPILDYNEEIEKLIKDFSDARLRQAWSGQLSAYRHVRGAAFELAVAENAYSILHSESGNTALIADIVEVAEGILNQITEWNLSSLKEIINYTSRPESPEDLNRRLRLTRPSYVFPVAVAAARAEGSGSMSELELAFETMPRAARDAIGGSQYYCWAHISRRLNKEALTRLGKALESFGFEVLRYPEFKVAAPAVVKQRVLSQLSESCAVDEVEKIAPASGLPTALTALSRDKTENQNCPGLPCEQESSGQRRAVLKTDFTSAQGNQGNQEPTMLDENINSHISGEPETLVKQRSNSVKISRVVFQEGGGYEEVSK